MTEVEEKTDNSNEDSATCNIVFGDLENIDIVVTTSKDRIDSYLDEKRILIAEKIGKTVDKIDEETGSVIRMYLMSGKMLRSALAILCYEANGGKDNDADDIAAIIELACNVPSLQDDIIKHDYARDIDTGIKSVLNVPGEILRGNFSFFGNALDAIRGSPKAVADGIDIAKVAVGDTIAMIWRGDYVNDSPYISAIKAKPALSMAIACRAGAEKAMSEECVELCHIYGRNLGIAYTVAEDLCKILSAIRDNELNDDLGLAMLYGLDKCGANVIIGGINQKDIFKEIQKDDNLEEVVTRLNLAITKYTRNAIKAAKRLPDNQYRDMLVELPEYLFNKLKEEYNVKEMIT